MPGDSIDWITALVAVIFVMLVYRADMQRHDDFEWRLIHHCRIVYKSRARHRSPPAPQRPLHARCRARSRLLDREHRENPVADQFENPSAVIADRGRLGSNGILGVVCFFGWWRDGSVRGSPLYAYRAAPLSTERGREAHLDSVKLTMPSWLPRSDYSSSHTSSMRQPLNRLLTMTVSPFSCGCQQVAKLLW